MYLNRTQVLIGEGNDLISNLTKNLNNNAASPNEIKRLAEEVRNIRVITLNFNINPNLNHLQTIALNLQLDPDEIKKLANKIDETVAQLEDVETIIHNTRYDLDRVQRLKESAGNSR